LSFFSRKNIREINGIRFVNDSKATTVESLAVALQSFDHPIILIAGGKDKGSDFSKLNNLIWNHVHEIILIGVDGEKIAKIWKDIKPVHLAESMEEAVQLAFKQAKEKDTVLLSPACASFDMFSTYEQRGKIFKKAVEKLD